jgi:hypothetical protein
MARTFKARFVGGNAPNISTENEEPKEPRVLGHPNQRRKSRFLLNGRSKSPA